MTDRELLELAAKAAGRSIKWDGHVAVLLDFEPGVDDCSAWNPLKNDGDALRLAVKLGLYIEGKFTAHQCVKEFIELGELAAVRRAIVRAAAAIGQSLGEGESNG